ncbi:hypothetical protein LCGC14_0631780 [marine sediment metagenome]|uniref:histidine kinase n=1 Tax=marine sediment metagenome TaxID=412755 RepID=A0A0F9R1N6_9ZZZZ
MTPPLISSSLLDPADPPGTQTAKLMQIAEVLMRRVEQSTDDSGAAYAQFQRAALLEDQVRERTRDLEHTLDLLNTSNARLEQAHLETEAARQNLANAIETIQEGFAMFDSSDILVMCNSRFGMHMPDIAPALKPGLSFDAYVGLVSTSRSLELPPGETPEGWSRQRKRLHTEKVVNFNVNMSGDHWVQVSEHRTMTGGTVILQTDVTDIIRIERQERSKLLDNQARMIRATLDHINQGVVIFDKGLQLVGWNQRVGQLLALPITRFRLGSSFELLLTRLRAQISFGGTADAAMLLEWARSDRPRKPLFFEVTQGESRILDVYAQEMPDRGFVISFNDVTAEHEARRALSETNNQLERRVMARTLDLEDALAAAERANASKSRFVAAASHDLLQPLSAAKLYVSSVTSGEIGAETRNTLERAHDALESVEGIIDALLDISKLESGRSALDVIPVPLARILGQLENQFAPLARQKGLDLRIVTSGRVVQSDATYLRRILQNLIGNALRYTERGRVLVGARLMKGCVRLEVWDTGPGIEESDQERIFEEFQRLHSTASASQGMGLGLAIVDRACAQLGHPLGLRSVVGVGTVFFLTVPLADRGSAGPGGPQILRGPRIVPPSGLVVLLVENDPEFRRAITLLMEKWHINVLDCASAAEAQSLLEEIGIVPDVVLIDYQLDTETGLDVHAGLSKRYGHIPSRILTANRSAEIAEQCRAAGLTILQKPIDANELSAFLASALSDTPDR